jgi:hypothetical protein
VQREFAVVSETDGFLELDYALLKSVLAAGYVCLDMVTSFFTIHTITTACASTVPHIQ